MRTIDADALKIAIIEEGQRSKRYKMGEFWELNREEIWKVIDCMPTIEERKTKLSIPVIVYIDDVESFIREIKGLQTYKLHEGDDNLLVERDEVVRLLIEHIEAKVK